MRERFDRKFGTASMHVLTPYTHDKLLSFFESELKSLREEIEEYVHRYTERETLLMDDEHRALAKEHNKKLDDVLKLIDEMMK